LHPKKAPQSARNGQRPFGQRTFAGQAYVIIESIAEGEKTSRSDAIRQLIERGLQAWIEEQR
jgi:hypothetical protein